MRDGCHLLTKVFNCGPFWKFVSLAIMQKKYDKVKLRKVQFSFASVHLSLLNIIARYDLFGQILIQPLNIIEAVACNCLPIAWCFCSLPLVPEIHLVESICVIEGNEAW